MATPKECNTLTSYFEKAWAQKYGRKSNVNRYKARWGFDAVLGGMSLDNAKELIDFYLTTANNRDHDLEWFFYNYDKLEDARDKAAEDRAEIERLKEETKKRASEWSRRGYKRITTD